MVKTVAARDKLHLYGGYKKACELFDLVVTDMTHLSKNSLCYKLVSQQLASADSIAANIEEGYGRSSRADYMRFLVIARGSATETRGRYEMRFKHWLSSEIIRQRVNLCEEIIAILSATLKTLRSKAT